MNNNVETNKSKEYWLEENLPNDAIVLFRNLVGGKPINVKSLYDDTVRDKADEKQKKRLNIIKQCCGCMVFAGMHSFVYYFSSSLDSSSSPPSTVPISTFSRPLEFYMARACHAVTNLIASDPYF